MGFCDCDYCGKERRLLALRSEMRTLHDDFKKSGEHSKDRNDVCERWKSDRASGSESDHSEYESCHEKDVEKKEKCEKKDKSHSAKHDKRGNKELAKKKANASAHRDEALSKHDESKAFKKQDCGEHKHGTFRQVIHVEKEWSQDFDKDKSGRELKKCDREHDSKKNCSESESESEFEKEKCYREVDSDSCSESSSERAGRFVKDVKGNKRGSDKHKNHHKRHDESKQHEKHKSHDDKKEKICKDKSCKRKDCHKKHEKRPVIVRRRRESCSSISSPSCSDYSSDSCSSSSSSSEDEVCHKSGKCGRRSY